MTREQCENLADVSFDLCPKSRNNRTLRDALAIALRPYEYEPAMVAIVDHAQAEEFISLPAILNRLRPPVPGPQERQEAERRAYEARRANAPEVAADAYWRRVDEFIAEISDEWLEKHKAKALLSISSGARSVLERRTVRESRTLRGLVYEMLVKAGAA